MNRAICAYPPGSTFKAITALAGLREGLAEKSFNCSGGVSYGDHYFQCWKSRGHGRLTVIDAMKVSCNAFFYQYGNAAGIGAIDLVGGLLGLGQLANVGLTGEQAGILPSPAWMKHHSPTERWTSAQTANVSIGQGYDLVSPLQLVMAYSAIANGGTAYHPHLVEKITNFDGTPLLEEPPGFPVGPRVRARLSDAGVQSGEIEMLRTAFWKVVNEDGGTARRARLPGGIVAGKTGTAQAQIRGRDDTIAWFVSFAPYDQPRYAVCVMVQGGAHGGSVAAPIAARILEETLDIEAGTYQPAPAALPPARHRDPFRMIEAVVLASSAARVEPAGDEEPAGPSATAPGVNSRPQVHVAPRVRKAVPVTRDRNAARPHTERSVPKKNFFQWLFHSRR